MWPGVRCAVQHRAAKTHGVAVLDAPIDVHRGEVEIRTEVVIAAAAAFDHRSVLFADDDLRTRELLHSRVAAHMIEVRLRRQEVPHVGDLETECRNVLCDEIDVRIDAGLDQNRSRRRGDQVRGEIFRSDVVHVADDLERLDRCGPIRWKILVGLERHGEGNRHGHEKGHGGERYRVGFRLQAPGSRLTKPKPAPEAWSLEPEAWSLKPL